MVNITKQMYEKGISKKTALNILFSYKDRKEDFLAEKEDAAAVYLLKTSGHSNIASSSLIEKDGRLRFILNKDVNLQFLFGTSKKEIKKLVELIYAGDPISNRLIEILFCQQCVHIQYKDLHDWMCKGKYPMFSSFRTYILEPALAKLRDYGFPFSYGTQKERKKVVGIIFIKENGETT